MDETQKILPQLSAYLDEELSEADARRVEQALQEDPQLAEELEQLETVRSLLRSLPRERAPKDFVQDVLAKAERPRLVGAEAHDAHDQQAVQWVRFLASAAVLLIAVGIGAVLVAALWNTSTIKPEYPRIAARPPAAPAEKADKSYGRGIEEDGRATGPEVARKAGHAGKGGGGERGHEPGGATALKSANVAPERLEFVMNADSLPEARRELETTLNANDIVLASANEVAKSPAGRPGRPATPEAGAPGPAASPVHGAAKTAPQAGLKNGAPAPSAAAQPATAWGRDPGNNLYRVRITRRSQISMEIVATPDRIRRVLAAAREVRARQRISQDAPLIPVANGDLGPSLAAGDEEGLPVGARDDNARDRRQFDATNTVNGLNGKGSIETPKAAEKQQRQRAPATRTPPPAKAPQAAAIAKDEAAPPLEQQVLVLTVNARELVRAKEGKGAAVRGGVPAKAKILVEGLGKQAAGLKPHPVQTAGEPAARAIQLKRPPATQPAAAAQPPSTQPADVATKPASTQPAETTTKAAD